MSQCCGSRRKSVAFELFSTLFRARSEDRCPLLVYYPLLLLAHFEVGSRWQPLPINGSCLSVIRFQKVPKCRSSSPYFGPGLNGAAPEIATHTAL